MHRLWRTADQVGTKYMQKISLKLAQPKQPHPLMNIIMTYIVLAHGDCVSVTEVFTPKL